MDREGRINSGGIAHPMDRMRFQFSLYSLFVLTTACAVLLSLVKTFSNAAVAEVSLTLIVSVLFIVGNGLILHSILFPDREGFGRSRSLCVGILFVIVSFLLCRLFLH